MYVCMFVRIGKLPDKLTRREFFRQFGDNIRDCFLQKIIDLFHSDKFFCCHAAPIWRVSYKKQKVWSSSVYLVEGSDKPRNE